MERPWVFRCMRCGEEYVEAYDSKAALIERSCPKCRSNSVRPLREQGTEAKAKGG